MLLCVLPGVIRIPYIITYIYTHIYELIHLRTYKRVKYNERFFSNYNDEMSLHIGRSKSVKPVENLSMYVTAILS